MEEIFPYLVLAAVVLFGPWVLLFATRRRMRRERREDAERLAGLTRRVFELETALKQVKLAILSHNAETGHPAAESVPAQQSAPSMAPIAFRAETATTQRTQPFEIERPQEAVPSTQASREAPPVAAPAVAAPVQAVPSAAPESVAPPPPPPPVAPQIAPRQQEPLPSFTQPASSGWFDSVKGGFNLEEALGANWLNKIGIVILVFGVAFFLAYQLRQVGPAGKVVVGALVSAALLGGGIFLERKKGYAIIGRAGIGGGWALAFFTAYAVYHVPAARIFTSQTPSLLLMLAVAAAMVLHTLRYRSQVVTGLAFLLAFSTLTISQVTVYSLVAGAILALGLVVIVGCMQWFELETFGIAAAYLNHWWWLRRIIEPMGPHKHKFPEFWASAAMVETLS